MEETTLGLSLLTEHSCRASWTSMADCVRHDCTSEVPSWYQGIHFKPETFPRSDRLRAQQPTPMRLNPAIAEEYPVALLRHVHTLEFQGKHLLSAQFYKPWFPKEPQKQLTDCDDEDILDMKEGISTMSSKAPGSDMQIAWLWHCYVEQKRYEIRGRSESETKNMRRAMAPFFRMIDFAGVMALRFVYGSAVLSAPALGALTALLLQMRMANKAVNTMKW